MGLPEGWVTDLVPNRRALHTLGNGVVPQQAAAAIRLLVDRADGPSPRQRAGKPNGGPETSPSTSALTTSLSLSDVRFGSPIGR